MKKKKLTVVVLLAIITTAAIWTVNHFRGGSGDTGFYCPEDANQGLCGSVNKAADKKR